MSNSKEIVMINLFPDECRSSQISGYGKTTLTSTKPKGRPGRKIGFFHDLILAVETSKLKSEKLIIESEGPTWKRKTSPPVA